MALIRVFTPELLLTGQVIVLAQGSSDRLLKVLRCKPGDGCRLFNGNGREYQATLMAIESRRARLQVGVEVESIAESPLQIHLLQGISRGERMDYAIQKSVECGVASITPIFTERCNVKLSLQRSVKRQQHWHGVAVSAAEQSGRVIVPRVNAPRSFREWLTENSCSGFIADPGFATMTQPSLRDSQELVLLIGPEGGFDSEEIRLATDAGLQRLGLGPRILRTETASVVALTLLQIQWGDIQ